MVDQLPKEHVQLCWRRKLMRLADAGGVCAPTTSMEQILLAAAVSKRLPPPVYACAAGKLLLRLRRE